MVREPAPGLIQHDDHEFLAAVTGGNVGGAFVLANQIGNHFSTVLATKYARTCR